MSLVVKCWMLSETAEFFYKCDNFYSKEHDAGILYNDETLNIDWKINPADIKVSEKDANLPTFPNALNNFQY